MGIFHFPCQFVVTLSCILIWCLLPRDSVGETTSASRVDRALQNVTGLVRPGKVGYATIWDGNKFVQCRRMPDRDFRCEAAGTQLQPSLQNILTSERLSHLAQLGWMQDASFGQFVRTFPARTTTANVALEIIRALSEGYGAEIANLDVATAWVADVPCPPRNGFSQNLAGMVSDAPEMSSVSLNACSHAPPPSEHQAVTSAVALIGIYGDAAAAEIQRLRVNAKTRVWVIFGTGIGYVQCMPDLPPSAAIYCEAQSAESWPALTAVLTPQRVAQLRSTGYAEPGRSPNFSKIYADKLSDAEIADEILAILHDVYGYSGVPELEVKTEK